MNQSLFLYPVTTVLSILKELAGNSQFYRHNLLFSIGITKIFNGLEPNELLCRIRIITELTGRFNEITGKNCH